LEFSARIKRRQTLERKNILERRIICKEKKMKKKTVLVILLLVVFLVESYASVGAKTVIRVTGSMNYQDPFSLEDDPPRAWGQLNFIIDPDGNPQNNATGFAKFAGYATVDQQPKDFRWYGSAVCGDFTADYDGNPAVVIVIQIEEATEATNMPLKSYLKFLIVDGGQNVSKDTLGLIFPFVSVSKPSCSFEPSDFNIMGVGGNVKIH
jgi:hypothetical protein